MALDDFTENTGSGGENKGGDYFKPADNETALAILVETESYDATARNPFHDPEDEQSKPVRPEATATLSIFENQGQVSDGEPRVIVSAIITAAKLARDLGANVGKSVLVTVEEKRFSFKTKAGKPVSGKRWEWIPVEDKKIREAVGKYIEERDSSTPPWEA